MRKIIIQLGVLPTLLLGASLFIIGLFTLNHIINNWWFFDVQRLDLMRATALDRADAATLLAAANPEIIIIFLTAILTTITGLFLPSVTKRQVFMLV